MNSDKIDWPKIIIHADMDAFFAAVEQLDNPSYRGKPLIIGKNNTRSVVSTASYEARPYGLKSAMPVSKAIELCPHVIIVPPRMKRYKEISSVIMDIFTKYSPLVEPLSIDEAFIDMTGATQIFGSPFQMAKLIKQDVFAATKGLTVSIGVATTKFVAKVASDYKKPDGITIVPPGSEKSFLWPLPVSRIFGIGKKSQNKIKDLGISTIGDLAEFSLKELSLRFGKQGTQIWNLANAIDPREVTPKSAAKSIGREFTLSKDITGSDAVWPHLRKSADSVARTLRKEGLLAGGVRIKLKTGTFQIITKQAPNERPTDSAAQLLKTAERLIKNFNFSVSIRLIGLTAIDLTSSNLQQELFVDKEALKKEKLDKTIDKVIARFGENSIKRGENI
jgi:DNA polymerase-4